VLLVSHDRAFLDNVVTQTLAAEGDGTWKEYVGGYSDWLAQRTATRGAAVASPAAERKSGARAAGGPEADGSGNAGPGTARDAESARPAKLSYKESRELEQLPGRIEALEAEQLEIAERMSGADYHLQGAARLRADAARIEAIEAELAVAYECWAALDARVTR
jgi:ATP-binding cassette subfamily F protein uup